MICGNLFSQNKDYYIIPKQTKNLIELLGVDKKIDKEKTINTFEITTQIKLKEYNEYLIDIKRDSSELFYFSQLPDTSICKHSDIELYLNDLELQNEPIVGISWESAMNFCKWKTIKENSSEIKFIYRLPFSRDWIFAYNFLENSGITNDFNDKYSDWLINSKDESYGSSMSDFEVDYIYFAKNNAPQVLKRKVIIGNSYLFKQPNFIDYFRFSYYSNIGYPQAGFRCVKNYLSDSVLNDKYSIESILLKEWNLKSKEPNLKTNTELTNDNVIASYQTENELLNGYYISKYANGKIKSTGRFIDNQKYGIWSVWDSLGILKNQRCYKNNYEFETIFPIQPNIKTTKYISNAKYELNYNSDNYIEYFNPTERMVYSSYIIWSSILKANNQEIFNQNILEALYKGIKDNKIVCYTENFKDTIIYNNLPLIDTIELAGIKIKELWYFDTYRFIAEKRIINFVPLIVLKNSKDTIDLGNFYFPELRKEFASIKIETENAKIKTLNDLFFFHYYKSVIFKTENLKEKYIDYEHKNYDIELIEKENDILINFN